VARVLGGRRLSGRCEVCDHAALRLLRHSAVWDFDVARCRHCRTVQVVDPIAAYKRVEDAPAEATTWFDYERSLRGDEPMRREVLRRVSAMIAPTGEAPALFDVGTGDGEFLRLAEAAGFVGAGNDISPSAVEFARENYGREVSVAPLAEQPPQSVDAVTMWCVLAHVPVPLEFLREARAMLRPGGVLFLRTPRWCAIDTVGIAAARATNERVTGLAERRVTQSHMHFYNRTSLALQLRLAGFTDVTVESRSHYPFVTSGYLQTIGGRARLLEPAVPVLDGLIARGWFVRNALLAYARRDD
jgi:2-polyprenyl-3-methyl-5-hydroxy-6-metoxy-1,4-benzoquinol methylase